MWGVSITHPVRDSFLRGKFLLHIPSWLNFHLGSSPTHPMLASFLCVEFLTLPELVSLLCGEFLLHIPCWLLLLFFFFFFSSFFLFLSGEFFLHIPRWLYFSVGSFSYTSHACLIFLWGVSLTHPMLAFFFFFLNLGSFSNNPCWL